MKTARISVLTWAALALTFSSGFAEEAPPTDFVRFVEDDKGAQLQTAVATYRNKEGITVDLIGAIHVADGAYYEKLNESFKTYDALLYEMVGGPIQEREKRAEHQKEEPQTSLSLEEAQEIKASQKLSWLHTLYSTLQKSLALESQLDGIDYHQDNFVHADMSIAEFTNLQAERNEGFIALWLRAVKSQMEQPEVTAKQPGLLKILEILCRQDSPTELKRLFGRSFDSMETIIAGMETGDGTVIITERNKVALEAMQEQMALGKKHLGIFYGAAHFPEMEKRLLEMGFKPVKLEWLTAWDLPPEPPPLPKPDATSGIQPRSPSSHAPANVPAP